MEWYKDYCDTIDEIQKPDDPMWYSYKMIDSYGALFNFIIGARGDGKSYGAKKKAIKHFMKTGRQSVYLRRTEGEKSESMDKFIVDIEDKYYPYRFRILKNQLQICEYDEDAEEYVGEWETVIHFCYLANSIKLKSVNYSKVDYIFYDEVIIEETKDIKYLTNEIDTFLHFYETVARMRDVTCYFLSNAVDIDNPYFNYWNIVLPNTKSGLKRIAKEIVIEIVKDDLYKQRKRETRFGQVVAGTEYEKHAIDNQFILNTEDQIGKLSANSHYWKNLVLNGEYIAIYADTKDNTFYGSNKVNRQWRHYVVVPEITRIKKTTYTYGERVFIGTLVKAFYANKLYYEDQHIKSRLSGFLKKWGL